MKIQQIACVCRNDNCLKHFLADIPVQCAVDVVCAALKAIRCPACRSEKTGLVTNEVKADQMLADKRR